VVEEEVVVEEVVVEEEEAAEEEEGGEVGRVCTERVNICSKSKSLSSGKEKQSSPHAMNNPAKRHT
jgi:hypothetical protein